MFPSLTRIFGVICTIASCDKKFSYPIIDSTPRLEIRAENVPPMEVHLPLLGTLNGYEMKTVQGRGLAAFESIPYAEVPTGKLRFKDPVEKKAWNCSLDATKTPNICMQMDPTRFYNVHGSEDCLYLNVYVSPESTNELRKKKSQSTTNNNGRPVIVWIHGGSFFWGASTHYGPSYLLDYDKNAILVTLNYRLGPLGFFSTGNDIVPGNLGLKDQAMAINWVKKNIKAFGGDPDNISLMGHSAGAACTHLQMMGTAKNLFKRAISQSGTAFSEWSLPKNVQNLSFKLAQKFDCANEKTLKISLDCLQRVSAHDLVSTQYQFFEWNEYPSILFGPVVEHDAPGAFLTATPEEMYLQKRVANITWITGVTADEGDLAVMASYLGPMAIQRMLRNFEQVMPIVLMYNKNDKEMTSKVREFYFGDFIKRSFHGYEAMHNLGELFGDRYFYAPFHKALRIHSENIGEPLYAYFFSYKGRHGIPEKFQLPNSQWGVMHMDELMYLFNSTEYFKSLSYEDFDFPISEYMTELWLNFATNGQPKMNKISRQDDEIQFEEWEPYTPRKPKLLDINVNSGMIPIPYLRRISFWKKNNYY